MLKIRRPLGRLIFNMGIAIPGKTVFLIETAPWTLTSWIFGMQTQQPCRFMYQGRTRIGPIRPASDRIWSGSRTLRKFFLGRSTVLHINFNLWKPHFFWYVLHLGTGAALYIKSCPPYFFSVGSFETYYWYLVRFQFLEPCFINIVHLAFDNFLTILSMKLYVNRQGSYVNKWYKCNTFISGNML